MKDCCPNKHTHTNTYTHTHTHTHTYIYIYIYIYNKEEESPWQYRLEQPKLCYHPGWRLMRAGYHTCFHTWYDEYIYIYIYKRWKSPRGVMVNVLDCDFVVNEL